MPPSPVSASSKDGSGFPVQGSRLEAGTAEGPASRTGNPELVTVNRVLVVGVNWVGDSVMTMPALQAYRAAHPSAYLALLVKPGLAPLWRLHAAPDEVLTLEEGWRGLRRTARRLKALRFDRAYVLPHSFRSALVPWLARIPSRIGPPGHWRDFMLTDVIRPSRRAGREHQAYEYADLLLPGSPDLPLPMPRLTLPDVAVEQARRRLGGVNRPCVALMPGAARGPSKQWPAGHFVELGRTLANRLFGIVVLGVSRESALCERVAQGIGVAALNLAGKTSLAEWIGLLRACDLVVANDSGGMHLAAAVGTPVAAIYGTTDPARTGPMGAPCKILQNSEIRSRDIAPDSPAAVKCLASIEPEQVYRAALQLLGRPEQP